MSLPEAMLLIWMDLQFVDKCLALWLRTICSIILQHMQDRKIGW